MYLGYYSVLLIPSLSPYAQMVIEEKFTLLFCTHFTVGGGEMDVAVRAMSLSVVVIVHVTQQPPAEATIFWDNAFSEAVSSCYLSVEEIDFIFP